MTRKARGLYIAAFVVVVAGAACSALYDALWFRTVAWACAGFWVANSYGWCRVAYRWRGSPTTQVAVFVPPEVADHLDERELANRLNDIAMTYGGVRGGDDE